MSRRGTCWQIYQPCFWTLIATILVNIQPMLILIIGSWKMCCASCDSPIGAMVTSGTCEGRTFPPWSGGTQRECHMSGNYFWDESYCLGTKLPIFPTKASGWAIQILCTWGGFVFMFVGVMQATQLHKKTWEAMESNPSWTLENGTVRTMHSAGGRSSHRVFVFCIEVHQKYFSGTHNPYCESSCFR